MAEIIKNNLWVEKYRPKNTSEYVFQNSEHRKQVTDIINKGIPPHLILSGVQGSGKTSLAFVLIEELQLDPMDVLIINASDDNNVDTVRDKIKGFVTTYAMGEYKLVLLEESDYLSAAGQAILRRLMEEFYEQARFILTCNYVHKIIPAIRSRCQEFKFEKFDKTELTLRAAEILVAEGIKFDIDTLDTFVDRYYPDFRKIINTLQQFSTSHTLVSEISSSDAGDFRFKLIDFIEQDDWLNMRSFLCSNVSADEWETVYRILYENLGSSPTFSNQEKWDEGIITIAEHLYKHTICADPEINAAAMLIKLSTL